jgi:hypothetical protein
MLCLSYYAYVFSSTKLEIGQNSFCLEVKWGGEERVVVVGERGTNDPNNVCICE